MKPFAPALLACASIGCGGTRSAERSRIPSEVEFQLAAARSGTIPSDAGPVDSSGPTRDTLSISAKWSFDLRMDWDTYTSQAVVLLKRAGYEIVSKGQDSIALADHVPGDSYRVRVARERSPATRVTVTFTASPD